MLRLPGNLFACTHLIVDVLTESIRIKKFVFSLCIVFIFHLSPGVSFCQNYTSKHVIYSHQNVTVELLYVLNDPCGGSNPKVSRFFYIVTGTPKGYDQFLNWKMDYLDCSGKVMRVTNSINIGEFVSGVAQKSLDWTFNGSRLIIPFHATGMTVTNSPAGILPEIIALKKSEPAKSITGNRDLNFGEQTTLSADGGELGLDAKWKWYENNCGGMAIGEGKTITVSPVQNTVYFVRAESPTESTPCFSADVSVSIESKPANHIEGRTFVCGDEKNIRLVVSGGKLGKDASWVWYQDNVQGSPIGRGNSILVSPISNTTYLVRAEGSANTTPERSISIKIIDEKLPDPDGIKGIASICQNSGVTLTASGGQMPDGSQWAWYKDGIASQNLVGKGVSITVSPASNTTYYLRGEGVCNVTKEKSITLTVNTLSAEPISINERSNKKRVTLSVIGGNLGHDASWKWYKGSCTNGRKVGSGSSISVRVKKTTSFFVRAEGDCNTTSCASKQLYPSYNHRHFFVNFGVVPNFHNNSQTNVGATFQRAIDNSIENPVVSLTFGSYKKNGWYFRGKYNINNKAVAYDVDDDGQINNPYASNYYVFNGETSENRLSATVGWITKLNKNSLFFTLGAGYGKRDLLWSVDEYSNQDNSLQKTSWAKHNKASLNGIEVETGIMLRFLVFNIMAGVNGIVPVSQSSSEITTKNYKVYIDTYVGFGFTF